MNRQFLLVFSWMVFLFACSDSKEQTTDEAGAALPPLYYYYPRANVYFDSANKVFFFQTGDSAAWQSARQIPAVVQALMDKSAFIQSPSDPVWQDNENHRLVYSASLYATPADTVAKKPVTKVVAKKPEKRPDSTSVLKKERKGLGKFIEKIFSRKKEKKEGDTQQQQQQ
jgi:hypothetical protein